MVPFILLVPLVLSIIAIAFLNDQDKAKYIALGGSLVSLALLFFVSYGTTTIPWFSVGSYTFSITAMVSSVNMLLLAIILLITPLILLYSFGYMDVASEQRRYYIEILSFATAMLAFAMSGNFIMLFIAWEFLSLTSYLLIGFWHDKERPVRAARKALTIIFIGDIALLLSIVMLFNIFGTLEFGSILAAASVISSPLLVPAVAMLVIAIFTKSAQFPFHEWLIDAMEGPTPVSAFLHSSTMVKAGVFVVILLFPLFKITGLTSTITIFAVITAILATFNAVKEKHIKKVIAYSTIQELSLMLIAISSGALIAGIFFFFAQSFYKALLFFSSGAAMKATGKESLDEISGINSNKFIYLSTICGVLALAGFIPFDGYFANVALGSSITNFQLYILISAISFLTSIYIFRWFFATNKTAKGENIKLSYDSLPKSMAYSMVILAVATIAASVFFVQVQGFLSVNSSYNYMSNSVPVTSNLVSFITSQSSLLFLAIIIVGAVFSYLIYFRRLVKFNTSFLNRAIYTNWIFTLFYNIVAKATYAVAEAFGAFDTYLSETFDMIGRLTIRLGMNVRKVSVGQINLYLFVVILGILLMASFIYLAMFA